jgi:PAS domain S-box-containing protein
MNRAHCEQLLMEYQTLANASMDGFLTIGLEGRIVDANEAFARMSGYAASELRQMSLSSLKALDSSEETAKRLRQIRANGHARFESVFRGKGGQFPVDVSIALSPNGDKLLCFVRDLRPQKAAEAALQENEEEAARLRILIEQSKDGMVILDHDFKVYRSNQRFASMLGYTPEEMRQLHVWDWDPQWTREQLLERGPTLASAGVTTFETRHRRKDGTLYDAEISVNMAEFGDHFFRFCVVRDISSRKAAETALRESEMKFSKAFHLSPDAVYITDFKTGKYIEVNEGFERLTGYRREEIIGKSALELDLWVNPADRRELIERFRQGGRIQGYLARFRHRSGKELWGELSSEPIEIGGRRCALYTTRDVTERLRAEEERRRLEAQVYQAQKLDSLGSLAGGMAHDMNNVLGAILGLATAHLERQPQGSPLSQALATIAKACVRGRTLVRGLLDFSRQDLAEKQLVDLNAIVLDEIKLLERTTLQLIRLETDLESSLWPVLGDPAALSHALMNLCINAVDAMPEGGVLSLRTRNLGGQQVELTIKDSGCGMSPEILEKAMDPFFTTKPHGKGTGLGLSIAYGAVKAHRGRMEICSKPGRGTRIVMLFPVHEPEAAQPEAKAALPAPSARGRSLRILVVDDDELVRASLQDQLQYLGHTITLTSSGESALEHLEDVEPEAVILDMNMPGLGGAGTLPRLRALRPQVPVFLATGCTDQRALNLARTFPGVTILPKPFSLQELRAHLQAAKVGLFESQQ